MWHMIFLTANLNNDQQISQMSSMRLHRTWSSEKKNRSNEYENVLNTGNMRWNVLSHPKRDQIY